MAVKKTDIKLSERGRKALEARLYKPMPNTSANYTKIRDGLYGKEHVELIYQRLPRAAGDGRHRFFAKCFEHLYANLPKIVWEYAPDATVDIQKRIQASARSLLRDLRALEPHAGGMRAEAEEEDEVFEVERYVVDSLVGVSDLPDVSKDDLYHVIRVTRYEIITRYLKALIGWLDADKLKFGGYAGRERVATKLYISTVAKEWETYFGRPTQIVDSTTGKDRGPFSEFVAMTLSPLFVSNKPISFKWMVSQVLYPGSK